MKNAAIVFAVAVVVIALLVLADLSSDHSRIMAALAPQAETPDPQEEAA